MMEEEIIFISKAGTGIIIFLCLLLGSLSIVFVVLEIWFGLAINVIVVAFILHMFQTTRYTFKGSDLHISVDSFSTKQFLSVVSER